MRLRSILWWFHRFQETRIWRRLTRTRRRDGYRRVSAFRRLRVEGLEPRTVLTASFVGGPITTQNTLEDVASIVQFQIADDSVPLASLTLTATSDNQTVLPNANLALTNLGGGAYQLSSLPAANQYGSGLVTLTITGDGAPVAQSFTLNVTSVNDPPSFTKGADQSILNGAGAQSIPNWATSISPGPNETGQTLTFQVTNDNPSLFTVAPTINSSGTLTYTPSGVLGTAVVSVDLTDGGGTADGGSDTSATQTFTIQITATPVNLSGTLDPTFDGDGILRLTSPMGSYDEARGVARQADGKLVVVGTLPNSAAGSGVARFNADGTLDASFGTGGKITIASSQLRAVEIQSDGKILVAGDIVADFFVARLNSDGTFDTSFGVGGSKAINVGGTGGFVGRPAAMALQSDGKIVLTRFVRTSGATSDDASIVRLTSTGDLDTTFNGVGYNNFTISATNDDTPYDVAVQADGKLVMVGVTNLGAGAGTDYYAARFNADGTLDTAFNGVGYTVVNVGASGSSADTAYSVAIQADQKIVVGGNAASDFGFVRLNVDGTLDTTFNTTGKQAVAVGNSIDQIQSLVIQSDGKILAGGEALGATFDFALVRLTTSGALDASFDGDGKLIQAVGTSAEQVNCLLLQPDGKIVAVGRSEIGYNGGDMFIERLTSTGALDATFNGTGSNSVGFAAAAVATGSASLVMPDGRILVAGEMNGGASTGPYVIWMLNPNGTLDTTFGTGGKTLGTGGAGATKLALQSDGKILFLTPGSIRLGRVNANGSLDTSFGSSGQLQLTGGLSFVTALAVQTDGKILVAGSTPVSGTSQFAINRYLSNGTLDTTFDGDGIVNVDIGAGADIAQAIAVQSDGKILVSGYGNNGSNDDFAVVRLNSNGSLDISFSGDGKVLQSITASGDRPYGLLIQSDGKIVLGGEAGSISTTGIMRLLADGTLDSSFSGDGIATFSSRLLTSLQQQADGKLLFAGATSGGAAFDINVARLLDNGSLDTTFDGDGFALADVNSLNSSGGGSQSASLQSDGSLVVVGTANASPFGEAAVLRYRTGSVSGGPSSSAVADQSKKQGQAFSAVDFTVSHPLLSAETLTVTATSGNTTLLPDGNLSATNLGGGNRRLAIAPAAGQVGSALVTLTVSDGTLSYAETFTVTVLPNDPPTIIGPGTLITTQNGIVEFKTSAASALTLGDPDYVGGDETLMLSVTHGTLSLNSTGLTSAVGSGTSSITAIGGLTALNTALQTLVFTPTTGFVGSSILSLDLNDQGSGLGTQPKSATANVLIQVRPAPEAPTMMGDINPFGGNSTPTSLLTIGSTTYFVATNAAYGAELWKTDGTTAGTVLIKDINPFSASSSISNLTSFSGQLFFVATDGVNGVELWKSDGTTAGTVMVKNIDGLSSTSSPANLCVVGSTLFLSASDLTNGSELWKTDGTTAGTVLVTNINSGSSSSAPANLTNVNGTLFFTATDGASGVELWKSDGTAGGTVMVKDVFSGSNGSNPANLVNVNGTLYFTASEPTNGTELWKSDGTNGGTVLVKDIISGLGGLGSVATFTAVGNTLLFVANDFVNGTELWKSDGTSGGTGMIEINAGSASSFPQNFVVIGSTAYFSATTAAAGTELWKWDSVGGAAMVTDINPGTSGSSIASMANIGGTLYFRANQPAVGVELFKSDGTAAGTVLVKDINPGTGTSIPGGFAASGTKVVFTATELSGGSELWITDGTAAGTTLLCNINTSTANGYGVSGVVSPGVLIGNSLYFAANNGVNGTELWKSDGTAAGTMMVKDINPGASSIGNFSPAVIGNFVYFQASDGVNGFELWKSDGTAAGTVMVADISAGTGNSLPQGLTNINGTLYFNAIDGSARGVELWKSDGTAAGTVLVKDINSGSGSSIPTGFTNVNGTTYFTANDGVNGAELWKTDGTSAGTVMVKNILPGSGGGSVTILGALGSKLLFAANDGVNGSELWLSDGTTAGTAVLKDIAAGSTSSSPNSSSVNGGTMYFVANNVTNGFELWRTDGTAAGTSIVLDIFPGTSSSGIQSPKVVNGALYFSAQNAVANGLELWKSDGTAAGTAMVADISAGVGSSNPTGIFAAGDAAYMRATSPSGGTELYRSFGEAGSTSLIDVFPVEYSSSPTVLAATTAKLFFVATDESHGQELWVLDMSNAAPQSTGLANVVVGTSAANSTVNLAQAFSDDHDHSNGLLYSIVGNTNSALFSNLAIDGETGVLTLTYTHTLGTAVLTVRAVDSGGASTDVPLTVTVLTALTPSVTGATTAEETQSSGGLVITRNVASGPEVTHYKITSIVNGALYQNDGTTPIQNGDFITVGQGAAGLKFTPAVNFNGAASFQVQASLSAADIDLGGGPATASIIVTAVNDPPSFTKGADQSVLFNAGAQSVVAWATAISAGGGETGQTLTFQVVNDNPSLFVVPPTINASGTLSYTLSGTLGTANVSVVLTDAGGTVGDGVNTSAPQVFAIQAYAPTTTPAAGTLDPTWDGDGSKLFLSPRNSADAGNDVVRQADGKYLVVGQFDDSYLSGGAGMARFNADGGLDTSFGVGGLVVFGGEASELHAVKLDAAGKIVVVGQAASRLLVARFLSDGTLDSTFAAGGILTESLVFTHLYGLAIQVDGKLVVVGRTGSSLNWDVAVQRYNSNGTLDTTFDGDGKQQFGAATFETAYDVALQSDGKIVVAGYVGSTNDPTGSGSNSLFVRYNANGSLDTTFNGTGSFSGDLSQFNAADHIRRIALQADGTIAGAGSFNGDLGVVRLTATGAFDTAFSGDGLTTVAFTGTEIAYGLAIQADGKILVGGSTTANGNDVVLARLLNTGSIDSAFGTGGKRSQSFGSESDQAFGLLVQADGAIVAVGETLAYSGDTNAFIARWNADGSTDTSFDADGVNSVNFSVTATTGNVAVIQSDGKILVGGAYYTGTTQQPNLAVWRTNADGTPDTAFGVGGLAVSPAAAAGGVVYDLKVQADGKIVFASSANYANGLGRLTADGMPDLTFSGDGWVPSPTSPATHFYKSLDLQADGKIVAAGTFFSGGVLSLFIDRYNADGSLDASFDGDGTFVLSSVGFSNSLNSVVVQSDGKIVATGQLYNGATNDMVAIRLNSNGSYDAGFNGGAARLIHVGVSHSVGNSVIVQPNGKIVIGGDATFASTNIDLTFVRLNLDGSLDTSFSGDGIASLAPSTANDYLYDLTLQSDGKLVAAGRGFTGVGTRSVLVVGRLLADGSPDVTLDGDGLLFTPVGGGSDVPRSLTLQSDGKLVAAGYSSDGHYSAFVQRFYSGQQTVSPNVPSIVAVADQATNEDVAKIVDFTVSHATLPVSSVSVTATSDDQTLIPNAGLALANLGNGNWRLTATPAANLSGSALITLTASDGTTSYVETFTLTVDAVNDVPVVDLNGDASGTGFSASFTEDGGPVAIVDAASLSLVDVDSATLVGATVTIMNLLDGAAETLTANVAGTSLAAVYLNGVLTISGVGTVAEYQQVLRTVVYNNSSQAPTATSRQVTFTVFDDAATSLAATGVVTIVPVNDAPTAGANLGLTLAEGATVVLNGTRLKTNDVDSTTAQLVYTVTNLPAHGTLSLNGAALETNGTFTQADLDAGRITYTHDSSENFTDNFKFTVSDGPYALSDATFALTITPVNDAPTAGANLGLTLAEGATAIINGTRLKTNDVDNTTAQLVYTMTNLSAHGTVNLNGAALAVNGTFTQADVDAGRISYTHDSSENFSDSFQFTVTDSEFTLTSATFALTITPVNDAPTSGVNLGLTLAEGATAVIDGTRLKTNDVDNTSAQLVYAVTNLPTHGTLSLNGAAMGTNGTFTQADLDAGKVTYAHDSSENFVDNFQFTVTDGQYVLSETTFALVITSVNDAPTAGANLGLTLAEGATATIGGGLLKTNDVDNTAAQLVYTVTNVPMHGTVNLSSVALATNDTFTQADLDAGRISYTHDSSENFSDSFKFTVTDGQYSQSEATFALTITPVNDAPTAGANLGLTLAEGATAVVDGTQLKTNDVDTTPAQRIYTVTNLPAHGTVNLSGVALLANGTFTQADLDAGRVGYTHDSSENFSDSIQFTVTDGEFTLSSATFSLTITPVNDAPTAAVNLGLTLAEGGTGVVGGNLLRTDDVDNSPGQRVYTLTAVTAHGALARNGVPLSIGGTFTQADLDAGLIRYTHDSSENFSDQFKFTVADGGFTLPEATFTLTITPVNDAPTAGINVGLTLAEGATVVLDGTRLKTNDVDDTTAQLVYAVTNLPAHGTVNLNGAALAAGGTFTQADLDAGRVTYTHDSSENFSDELKFTVSDGEYALPEATFALTIAPVNDAPTVGVNSGLTLAEGAAAVVTGGMLRTDDVDNSTAQRTYALTAATTHGVLARDGAALTTGGTFTQADLDAGRISYTHDSSENFSDAFSFTVSDGQYTLPVAAFNIAITPVNDAPTAGANLGPTLAEGSTVDVTGGLLQTNDVDSSAAQLVYAVTSLPTYGTLNLNGTALGANGAFTQADLDAGRISYTHDSSENFADSFKFTVSDGQYALTEATFALTITPVNDAPTAGANLGLTLAEGATVVLDGTRLRTNDVDNSAAQLVYAVTSLPSHGTVNLNGTALGANGAFTQADLDAGRVTYTHDSSENFADNFKFTISDGQYSLNEATFALAITPVNDAPTAGANLGLTLAEGTTATIGGGLLQTNDVDSSAAQLVYTVTNLPAYGTLNLNGTALGTNGTFTQADLDAGRVTYTHDSSENFSDHFQFTVTDGQYSQSEATFALTITPVNDAPTAGVNLGLTLAEGATVVLDGTRLRTSDVDNTTAQLVYAVTNLPAHGTVNLSGAALGTNGTFTQADLDAGRVTYTHDSSENFTDGFKFTVTDGAFALNEATFALTITPVNDAPIAGVNLGLTLAEGATAVVNGGLLQTHDVDNTAAQLSYTVVSPPTHGTLNLNGAALAAGGMFTQADLDAGNVTYTHDSSENFSDQFQFIVADGEYSLSESAFSLTITPVNDAPTAGANLGLTLAEGATVVLDGTRLKTNDVDNTSAELVYTVTNLPAHGTVNLNGAALAANGAFTQADLDAGRVGYTHDSSENFTDQFEFTVTDGEYSLTSATVALNITPVNDAPTAGVNLGLTLAEGGTATIAGGLLQTNDVDNSTAELVYTVTNLPAHGTLNLNGAALASGGTFTQADLDAGRVSYTHDSSENFTDNFQFTVTDGEFALSEATFALVITPVNDAPVVAPQNFILYNKAVAGTIVGAVQAADRDAGQQRSFAIVGGNGALAINAATGVLTVVNSKLLVGTALNFAVRVTDDGVPPLATDAPISVSLRAADAPPTFAVVDGASAPLAVVNNQVKLTLDERTDVTATRNGLVIATLAAADVDEPGVVFPLTMTDKSGAFAFDAATGKLSIRDDAKLDYEKTRSFTLTFKATDHGLVGLPKPVTSTLTMTVQLTDRNDAPTVAPAATFKLKENNGAKVTVGTVKAADADGPAAFKSLQYAIVSQRDAAGDDVGIFSIDAARGTLMIAAAGALNYEARPQYTVVVRARDAAGLFADQTVTVQVIDVNEAVVLALLDAAQNPTTGLTVPENTVNGTLVGYLRIDNPDVTRPETFKITLGDNLGKAFAVGAFDAASRLAPITVFNVTKLNFEAIRNGQFTLSFSVSDSGFTSNDGSKFGGVTVNKTYNSLVTDVNEAPTAVTWKTVGLPSGAAPIPAGTLFGTALGVDPDKTPQAFTYSLPSATLNNDLFTIDPLTGQLRSSLALGRKGIFNLLIRVTDAGGLFFNQSVVIKT